MAEEQPRPAPRVFYTRPALAVARDLIGKTLWRRTQDGVTAGIIVETEAYAAADDPASHAYRGRTPRTRTMFGPPGYAYVYLSYGLHACLNVVTQPEGEAAAVLLRAVEPTHGVPTMRARRGPSITDRDLARGPGRLCQAFAITIEDDGADLSGPSLWLSESPGWDGATPIATTPRVGIGASFATDWPWRFVVVGSRWVSAKGVTR